jgi:phosphonate transport system substrate-binding protein
VAPADSGIASLADLEGKTVALGAADSVAGRRLQLAGLVAEKIDPEAVFGAVMQLESGDAALRAMVRGEADAAFVWSSMSGDQATGYSRGTLANLFASGEISMADIVVVWRSPPLIHGPFAVSRTLPEDEREAIASFLLRLDARRPAAYDMLNPFYGGGYVAVDPQDYAGVATLIAVDVDSIRLPGPPPAATAPAP